MRKVPTEGFIRVLLLFYCKLTDPSSEDNAWDDKKIMVHMMRNGLKTLRLKEGCLKIFGCLSTCVAVKNSSSEDMGAWIHVLALPLAEKMQIHVKPVSSSVQWE